jgi:hypothetical protein
MLQHISGLLKSYQMVIDSLCFKCKERNDQLSRLADIVKRGLCDKAIDSIGSQESTNQAWPHFADNMIVGAEIKDSKDGA